MAWAAADPKGEKQTFSYGSGEAPDPSWNTVAPTPSPYNNPTYDSSQAEAGRTTKATQGATDLYGNFSSPMNVGNAQLQPFANASYEAANASGYNPGSYDWSKFYNEDLNKRVNEYNAAIGGGSLGGMVTAAGWTPLSIGAGQYYNVGSGAEGVPPPPPPPPPGDSNADAVTPPASTDLYNELHDPLLYAPSNQDEGLLAARARFGMTGENAPVGPNNSQTMLDAWSQSHPELQQADIGAFYDNQRRIADEKLRSSMAAVGAYGSSAYGDMQSEMLTNIGAQQAKDESTLNKDYYLANLEQDKFGGGLAENADVVGGNIANRSLDYAKYMGNKETAADDFQLRRVGMVGHLAGQSDDKKAQATGVVGTAAQREAEMTEKFQAALISGNMALIDRATMAAMGVTATDMAELANHRTQASADMQAGMSLATMIAKLKGGEYGGGGGNTTSSNAGTGYEMTGSGSYG